MIIGDWTKNESYIAGIFVRQNYLSLIGFNGLFAEQKFDRIIEFGTGSGGFTLFLAMVKIVQNSELYSYDIVEIPNTNVRNFLEKNCNITLGDIFSIKQEIINLISEKDKRVLLLCDNADKIKEFREFSKYLKNNDVIMCHDYYNTKEEFENDNQRTWEWCEITKPDIQESIDSLCLYEIYNEWFKLSHWACFIKKEYSPTLFTIFPNELHGSPIWSKI